MLRHTALYFGVRAINGAIGLVSLYVLTRLLAPAEYGSYALGMSAIAVASSILFQWLNVSVSRFHGRGAETDARLLSEAALMFVAIAVATTMASAVVFELWDGPRIGRALAAAIAVGCCAMGLHNLHLQIVNSRGQPLRYGLITSTRATVALVGAVIALRSGFGAPGALFALALGCIVAVAVFGARWPIRLGRENLSLRKDLVGYGLPLSATFLATMLIDASDRFLIGGLLGPAAVAPYAASYDLAQQTVGVALNVFFLALYPRITRAWEAEGEGAARRELVPLANCVLVAAPLVTGLFFAFATPIAALLLGPGLRAEAGRLIPLIALAIAIGGVKSYLLDIPLLLHRRVRAHLVVTIVMATVNIALNLALIPRLGVLGSAFAAVASFAVGAGTIFALGRGYRLVHLGALQVASAVAAAALLAGAGRAALFFVDGAGLSTAASLGVALPASLLLFAGFSFAVNLGGLGDLVRQRRNAA